MTVNIFISFLCVSAVVSLIGAVLTLIKPFTSHVFSPKWHYYVTVGLVIMMLLPVRISIPEVSVSETVETVQIRGEKKAETRPVQITVESELSEHPGFMQTLQKYTGMICTAWLTVALAKLAWSIALYIAFLIRIKHHSKVIECPLFSLYSNRNAEVRLMSGVSSPFTTGILKPILVLPETIFPDEQLRFILAHEAVHINRFDVIIKWLAVIMKCIHWFNPVAYMICKKLQNESEIACDYEITLDMSNTEKTNYMNTIIALATAGKNNNYVFSTALSAKGKILERRFLMIKEKVKVSKTTAIVSVVIAIGILCTGVIASGILSSGYARDTDNSKDTPAYATEENIKNTTVTDNSHNDADTVAEIQTDISEAAENVFIWPCNSTEITAPFTPERNHYATDIKAERGSDVYASIDATVSDTGFDAKKGNYIVLEAGETTIELMHLQESSVEVGDAVAAGEVIGKVGSTGRATGPHLHYAVSIGGEYVDAAKLKTVELIIAE